MWWLFAFGFLVGLVCFFFACCRFLKHFGSFAYLLAELLSTVKSGNDYAQSLIRARKKKQVSFSPTRQQYQYTSLQLLQQTNKTYEVSLDPAYLLQLQYVLVLTILAIHHLHVPYMALELHVSMFS